MLTRVKEEKKQSAQSARLMAERKRAEIGKINLRLQTLLDSLLDGIIDGEWHAAHAKPLNQQFDDLNDLFMVNPQAVQRLRRGKCFVASNAAKPLNHAVFIAIRT